MSLIVTARRHSWHIAFLAMVVAMFGLWFGVWLRVLPLKPRATFTLPPDAHFEDISHDGRLAVAGIRRKMTKETLGDKVSDAGIRIYDLISGQTRLALYPDSRWNPVARFSRDASRLGASIHRPGEELMRMVLLDLRNEREVLTVARTSFPHGEGAFSPDGRCFLFRSAEEWSIRSADTGSHMFALAGLTSPLAFSPDSRWLACLAEDNDKARVVLVDVDRRCKYSEIPGHWPTVAFSPDSRLMAIAIMTHKDKDEGANEYKSALMLIHAETGQVLWRVDGYDGLINKLVFSPDGERITGFNAEDSPLIEKVTTWTVASGEAKTIELDPVTMQVWFDSRAHWARPTITVEEFGTDGIERTRVFDALVGEWRAEMPGGPAGIGKPHITRGGRYMTWPVRVEPADDELAARLLRKVTGRSEPKRAKEVLRIIDLDTRWCVASLPLPEHYRFSADSSTLVTWSQDGEVQVWDLPPRRPLALMLALSAAPTLLFSGLVWWRWGRLAR